MSEIKIVAAIMADEKTAYNVNAPLLTKPMSLVTSILLVGTNVEVFAQSTDPAVEEAKRGLHESLLLPSVATLISLGTKGADGKFFAEVLSQMDSGEKVTEVHGTDSNVWKLNGSVPNDSTSRIVKISQSDDMVEIVALPGTGTDLDKAGYFLHFTLMPFSFMRVSSEAPLDEWVAIQQAMLADEDDDEEEEEEEEEEEVAAAAPPPPPPPPMSFIPALPTQAAPTQETSVNGAATTQPATE